MMRRIDGSLVCRMAMGVIGGAALLISFARPALASEVVVAGEQRAATIRPLHGVNNGPLNAGETVDLSLYFREAAFPLVRLHDSGWPNPDIVDIHAIFPDMNADPSRAENYRFSRTDDYIRAIMDTGAAIVYRLGESIEHTRKKYNVHPPADYDAWTSVCLGIVRHYNEGWADGFRYNIRYWEIWNEPENRPAMWTGSDEDYFRLYATAARGIKSRFPDLKVGGPSIGAPLDIIEGQFRPTPFLRDYLNYCKKHELPLDFFSWHTYTDDPSLYARKAHALRALLDEYGFNKTELHLNEWNYLPRNDWVPMLVGGQGIARQRFYEEMGGAPGAAFVACALIDLQDSPVDAANYYTGDSSPFGLFTRDAVPQKTFYAMKAFRMLMDTPARLAATGGRPGQSAVCAGMNSAVTEITILSSNLRSEDKEMIFRVERIPWRGATRWEIFRLDSEHDLALVRSGTATGGNIRLSESISAPCVIMIKLKKSE